VVDLEQVVAAGVGHQPGAVADQQPVGVAVDLLAGEGAGAPVGVVGFLEGREVGHGLDAVQVDLEQLAEAPAGRSELLAGVGAPARVADQQVAGPARDPTSTGPAAATPPSSASEGRPVRTRCWDRLVIRVTAPLRPKQASPPSGPWTQGPAPPDPDSAT
jgi:hypothetical protein